MKKILLSLLTIALVSVVAFGATRAYFSDTETSTGNSFAAGTLDLTVDGNNGVNTIKFTMTNMKPGDTDTRYYTINNVGTIPGYLDVEGITVTNAENTRIEPEIEAGDTSDGLGELQNQLHTRIWYDANGNGVQDSGDPTGVNNFLGTITGGHLDFDGLIAGGGNSRLYFETTWPTSTTDNQAMGDSATLNLTFELLQNAD